MNMPSVTTPAAARAVLSFWFGPRDEWRAAWFTKNPAFDAEIAQRFATEIAAALEGRLDDWQATPEGGLALLLLLDQFTRNTFRDTPRAFAGDARALAVARGLVDAGAVAAQRISVLRRWFMLMPFEHAEDLAVQDEGLPLFATLAAAGGPHAATLADALDYARRHQVVIARFGRFPHRNAVLGRTSTPEEALFLQQPGSRF